MFVETGQYEWTVRARAICNIVVGLKILTRLSVVMLHAQSVHYIEIRCKYRNGVFETEFRSPEFSGSARTRELEATRCQK